VLSVFVLYSSSDHFGFRYCLVGLFLLLFRVLVFSVCSYVFDK